MPRVDIVVVGAGISGLAAAFELGQRGVSFVVLERQARAGGVILNEKIGDFMIDAGPDSLLIQKPDAIKLCEELGLGERLVSTKPPRLAYVQRNGKLYPLPAASVLGIPTRIGPFVRTGLFSWTGKLRMGAELFVKPRRDEADESIGAFITRRFGREATTFLAEPLLAGIHVGDVNRLSLAALFPRFAETERNRGSLLRAFRRQGTASKVEGAFKSLPGGLSEMVCALVKALPAAALQLNTAVTDVAGNGPFQVETDRGAAFEGRAAILTTPAFVTGRLMQKRDPELAQLCNEVSYASSATVALAFPRNAVRHLLNGSGYVVPRAEGGAILAVSWLSSKWPHRAPDDRVLVRTFVGGARDPQTLAKSDAELVGLSLAAIRPVLGISGDPLFARVYRFERANAQHEVGHLQRVEAIDRALARHPGLYVTGSGFRGVGIPDCVTDGRRTGRQAADWLKGSS